MEHIIVTTESQLNDIIAKAVNSGLNQILGLIQPQQPIYSPPPELLDVKQTAKMLNLAPSTVYGLVNRSALPYSKKGGKLRFKRSQLLDWIDSGQQKTQDQIEKSVQIHTYKPSKQ